MESDEIRHLEERLEAARRREQKDIAEIQRLNGKCIQLLEQNRQLQAALNTKYHINTKSRLFEGLAGGMFPDGALLATMHKLQGELEAMFECAYAGWVGACGFPLPDWVIEKYPYLEEKYKPKETPRPLVEEIDTK